MRISDLSRESGVPIATIKFYLREGLLPPGTAIAPRQAEYSEHHLRRLRVIRTLTEVGRLSLRAVRAVLEAVDDERLPTHELLGVAHHALGPPAEADDTAPDTLQARADVDRFVADLGWRVSADAPGRRGLARALVSLRRMGRDVDADVFQPYARVANEIAARELSRVPAGAESRAEAVETAVVGTVVFEAALVALRRLAQEHHSAERFSRTRGRRKRTIRRARP